jgi:nitrous oxidase accessory protein NosD
VPAAIRLVLTAWLAGTSLIAGAATFHVEKWGNNAYPGGCGARSTPCETISHAVGQATRNDRIRVGPGIYTENVLIVTEGLKLESTAGRHGTAIWAANVTLPAVIINAPKVRFGKPGKGFTVHRSTTDTMFSAAAGVWAANADGLRVEGNLALENRVGFLLSGEKMQIRDNLVIDNAQEGIICDQCPRANISRNRVSGNFRAMQITGSAGMRIDRNYIADNSLSILVDGQSPDSSITSNVSTGNLAEGMGLQNVDGLMIRGNIASILRDGFTQDNAINARHFGDPLTDAAKPLRAEHNLALGFDGSGLSLRDFMEARIQNNHALQNTSPGIYLDPDPGLTAVRIRNNATYENSSGGCNIENASAVVMDIFNQFIGSGFPCGPLVLQGQPANRPSNLNVRRASRL